MHRYAEAFPKEDGYRHPETLNEDILGTSLWTAARVRLSYCLCSAHISASMSGSGLPLFAASPLISMVQRLMHFMHSAKLCIGAFALLNGMKKYNYNAFLHTRVARFPYTAVPTVCFPLQSRKNIGTEGSQHMDSIGLDEQDYRRTSSSEASSSSQAYSPDEVFSPNFLTIALSAYPWANPGPCPADSPKSAGNLDACLNAHVELVMSQRCRL